MNVECTLVLQESGQITPVIANPYSYITAITGRTIQDTAESLFDSNTALVNETRQKMLLLAEVSRITPSVLILVLIQRTLCAYSQAVSIVVKASEYTGALPVTTRLLIEDLNALEHYQRLIN
jgi:hypothetical protein